MGYIEDLERYKKAGANILMAPTSTTVPQTIFTPVIEEIKLSPDTKNDKDCYQDKGKLQLSSYALAKLAACAGVMWDTEHTRRTDRCNNSDYVSYQAVGSVRRFDGSLDRQIGEYDIDMVVIAEEVDMTQRAKKDKTPQEIEYAIRKEVLYIRKHKLKKCETGAKSIVIRKLLAVKNGYTTQELMKPFVICRYVLVPDYNNPYIMRKLQDVALNAITGIYGGNAANQARITHTPEDSNQFDDGNVIDIPLDDDSYLPPGEPIHSYTDQTSPKRRTPNRPHRPMHPATETATGRKA